MKSRYVLKSEQTDIQQPLAHEFPDTEVHIQCDTWSVFMGRLFGIDVRISVLTIVGSAFWFGHVLFGHRVYHLLFLFIGISLIILLHEMGHALVAKYFGRKVLGILLIPPYAGIAFLALDTRKYLQNIFICLSGPVASLMTGLLFYSIYKSIRYSHIRYCCDNLGIDPFFVLYSLRLLESLAIISFLTAVFNMIPLYPLDGGRFFKDLLLILKIPEWYANLITLGIAGLCFSGLVYLFLSWKEYGLLIIVTILMIVSILSLTGALNLEEQKTQKGMG